MALRAWNCTCYIARVNVISRYFVTRFLLNFFGALLALMLVVLAAETLIHLNDVLEETGSWAQAMGQVVLRISANYLPILFPIAGFVSAFMTFGIAARTNEVLALKACGASPVRLFSPVLIAGVLLALLGFVVFETGGLAASRKLIQGEGADEQLVIKGNAFWFQRGRTLFRIRDGDLKQRKLEGVKIYYRDQRGRLLRSISARTATMEGNGQWDLEHVTMREFDPARPTQPAHIEQHEKFRIKGVHPRSLASFDPENRVFSLHQLRKRIEVRQRDGANSIALRAQLQERWSEPLLVLLFTLFAIPLGLNVEKVKSFSAPAMQGVVVITMVWIARGVGAQMATKGALPPAFAYWGALALFFSIGIVLALRTEK